jgi:hypothetical protein
VLIYGFGSDLFLLLVKFWESVHEVSVKNFELSEAIAEFSKFRKRVENRFQNEPQKEKPFVSFQLWKESKKKLDYPLSLSKIKDDSDITRHMVCSGVRKWRNGNVANDSNHGIADLHDRCHDRALNVAQFMA